ncbi:MAG: type II secretion system protein N [Gammaproteobacteria bacterium]|nr:type II secretion system protein N [Gammaproteobacteria bacterium]
MRWWIYLVTGAISYLVFMLAYLPARHALFWLIPDDLPVAVDDARGTLWKGSANQVFYRDIAVGASTWIFKPFALLLGQVGYTIDLASDGQMRHGDAAFSLLTGDTVLSGLQGSIGAAYLPSILDQPYIQLAGDLKFDIQHLRVSDHQVSEALGSLHWQDAVILKPVKTELGSLQFDLSGDETLLTTRVKDLDGPVKIDGIVELFPDGRYRINGKVNQTGSTEQGLIGLLKNIGRPQADGSTRIEYSGQL